MRRRGFKTRSSATGELTAKPIYKKLAKPTKPAKLNHQPNECFDNVTTLTLTLTLIKHIVIIKMPLAEVLDKGYFAKLASLLLCC